MNETINQLKREKPVITSITFYDKDNYVNFSDTDAQTDYFHGASLGINSVIEWLTEDGDAADIIKVNFINHEEQPKFYKRLNKLAKFLRYKIKILEKRGIWRVYENDKECAINPYCYKEFYLYDADKVREEDIRVL